MLNIVEGGTITDLTQFMMGLHPNNPIVNLKY